MIGAGNVLKKHAADHARRTAVTDEEAPEEDDLEICSRISFESAHSQCMENCGVLTLAVVCQGSNTKKLSTLGTIMLQRTLYQLITTAALKVQKGCEHLIHRFSLSHVCSAGGLGQNTFYVDYRTEDGSANAGSDYHYSEGTLVFKPGDTRKEIKVS